MSEPGARILVVDDNATNLKLVTLLLARGAYDVRTAANAHEALALVQSFKPRLISSTCSCPISMASS